MSIAKKIFIPTFVSVVVGILLYFFFLPAINLTAPSFWFYIFCILICGFITAIILDEVDATFGIDDVDDISVPTWIFGSASVLVALMLALGTLFSCSMFNANTYYKSLKVTDTTFEQEFVELDWNTVPQIDKASSSILGARKMGTLVDKVSQYDVKELYTQINMNGKPYRVSPLDYASLPKYFANKEDGIPGYVSVNCVSKEAEFIELKNPIYYSVNAVFSKDLKRHIRKDYPTLLFDSVNFEVDDEGNAWYIVPTFEYASGLGCCKVPTGCLLVNPSTGEITRYAKDKIPSWIDHSVDSDMAVDLVNSWGKYENGFLNTLFGQKNVKASTDGYGYVTIGDDLYLYTGITSKALDESNIGFILVNLRTCEAKYFTMPSAEEYSAMGSAEGQVQHLGYDSTFPILVNVDGNPTYFLSLKDNAGLVKKYAMVSVENIQQVVVVDSNLGVEHLTEEYLKLIATGVTPITGEEETLNITIKEIYTTIIEGNMHYYIVDETNTLYIANISTSMEILPLLKVEDKITVTGVKTTKYFNVSNINTTNE